MELMPPVILIMPWLFNYKIRAKQDRCEGSDQLLSHISFSKLVNSVHCCKAPSSTAVWCAGNNIWLVNNGRRRLVLFNEQ